jgi:heat shock protein HslJ
MKKIIIASLAMIFLAGFTNKQMKDHTLPFYNTKWYLTSMQLAGGQQDITPKKAFIKFNEEKKSAGGNGSCNSFGGSVTVVKDSLEINNIFSTKMFCEGVQQTENSFFELLGKVNRFEIKENKLSLYREQELLLSFTGE